ncbi:MAG: protein translocase subunit SecF [Actinomycetota bacterium]
MSGLGKIVRGEANFDIIGRLKMWAAVSGVLIAASFLGLFGRGLNLGLEFKGGTSLTVPLKQEMPAKDIEHALAKFDLADLKVQVSTDRATKQRQALVRTSHVEDRQKLIGIQTALAVIGEQRLADGSPNLDAVSLQDVGPTWGKQVSSKALRGLIVFLVLVALYIGVRFEARMAIAALFALLHDLIVTAGLYALIGFVVTPATVIALLTLLGYSLYDTVVVFDKIRENTKSIGRSDRITYSEIANRSVNQVLMRSINTSMSTLMPISALLFVGVYLFKAGTLEDLALALFIGMLVGTYSSIFVASPLLAVLKEREPRYRSIRMRAMRDSSGEAREQVRVSTSVDPDETVPSPVAPARPATSARVATSAPRQRGRKRGAGKGRRR